MKNPHTINWFEVPVTDIARATTFFETLMDVTLEKMDYGPHKMAMFPADKNTETMTVHGSLIQGEGYTPSTNGTVLYFNGGNDLSIALNKVETAGGKVTMPKTAIGENGFIAMFEDTEGNRLALHSPN